MSYTDIFNNDPNGLSMGMPTVNQTAAVQGAGTTPVSTGITPPTTVGAPTVAPPGGAGGVSVGGGVQSGPGFFGQGGIASMALGAIQTLGSLWNSFQQNKLAKQSFEFQKDAFQTNLENQEQSYNTALEDRINARYVTEGKSQAEADTYIKRNRL